MSSPQIYITINAAPNTNPQDLAQMVGHEVSKNLRTQQRNLSVLARKKSH